MSLVIGPRFELFFALAAVLDPDFPDPADEAASRWLLQTRRKVEQGFRRRLGARAAPEIWRRLAILPGTAALQGSTADVIDILADLPPAVFADLADDARSFQSHAVDILRRFDRLAFAALWRGAEMRLQSIAGSIRPAEESRGTVTFLSLFATIERVDLLAPSGETVAVRFLAPAGSGPRPHAVSDPPSIPSPPPPAINDPALIFRALGDATRYAIARLIAHEALTGAELARRLAVSGPTLTHHLHALRQARLVTEQRSGNRVMLRLDRRAIDALSALATADLFGDRPVSLRRSRGRNRQKA